MKTRKPVRLQGYDYSREGVYFVTICSKDRECMFGHPGVRAPLACARTLGIDARTIEVELTLCQDALRRFKHRSQAP